MQNTLQNSSLPLQQLYQLVAHYSVEQQFEIAEYIKKQALAVKWGQFANAMPNDEPDISELGIMEEIKAVRIISQPNRIRAPFMHSLQLDAHTEQALNQVALRLGLAPETVIENVLLEFLAEEQAVIKADAAYNRYLHGKESAHDLNDVVRELGLDN